MRPHRIECLFMLVLGGPLHFVGVLRLFVILRLRELILAEIRLWVRGQISCALAPSSFYGDLR